MSAETRTTEIDALLDQAYDRKAWHGTSLLDQEHQSLREAVAGFPPDRLDLPNGDGKSTATALILGIASHDLYHAGQVQLPKRLAGSA